MKFKFPNFDHLREIPEINNDFWKEINEGKVTIEDVVKKLQKQNGLLK